ncbi:MAG: hypothetical protein AAFX05_05165 [Planctomycetota bacterium]
MTDRDIEQMVQAFLDGELPPEQQDDFNRALDQDPELRRRVQVLEAAQDTLRRSYAPIVAPSSSHGPATRSARSRHRHRSRGRTVALVASLAVVVLAFVVQRQMTPPAAPVSASMAYAAFMHSERPTVVCDTPGKLIAYTTKMLGVGVTADFDAGVDLIGWRRAEGSYEQTRPGDPLVLLAKRDDGTKAVVIFQDARVDAPTIRSMDTLIVTPKRFGPVTAWEVGTIDDAMVLPLLREAD